MCLYAKKSSKVIVPKSKPIIGYKIFLLSGKKKLYSAYRFYDEFAIGSIKTYYKGKKYIASSDENVFDLSPSVYHISSGFFHYFLREESAVDRRIEMIDGNNYIGRLVIAKCKFWGMTYNGEGDPHYPYATTNITEGASKRMKILEMVI